MTCFINRSVTIGDSVRKYAAYIPKAYHTKANQHWPAIVFLHGIGERGDDGVAQTTVGIGPAIELFEERFSCIVVLPQCPNECRWHDVFHHLDAIIDDMMKTWRVDEDRVTLTGISMGGFGTWQYGARCGGRFAALAPVCGGGNSEDAKLLARLPIWAFHGTRDPVIPLAKSVEMVDSVRIEGGSARLTEYADLGHNCWDEVYNDRATVAWLLGQSRRQVK